MSHQDGLAFLWGEPDLLRYDRPLFAKPRVIEGGGRNAVGFAALEASVDSLLHLGIEALHSHVLSNVIVTVIDADHAEVISYKTIYYLVDGETLDLPVPLDGPKWVSAALSR